ncbi:MULTISPECIES: FecR family protein [unclassified Sphingomonas]|uniref:FecR family protein n=1 Tax=unclassified Sphingomonas TaxID=196159 RepID=UPI0006F42F36|nr:MULTISPECIES: FecR domain-containing protein [unclassified Sphingomonas]KQX26311.1 iron dicitrate transport regulator FecR [Sphingomonas sp. Root1294]KQY69381.1 iron dicitrate transport regulator FecR [Sphingomonas sp. Root50]KRB89639.1 iron dicitrate transport regulator FecR [Sphingomonas sp. Root720]
MAEDRHDMETAALDWVIRLRDPGFDGWEEFEAWLGADPAHAEAYHRLAIADQDMAELLAVAPASAEMPSNVVPLPHRSQPHRSQPHRLLPHRSLTRRAWLGGAIAASVAGLIGFGMIDRQPALYQVETAPGMRRTVTLGDGSRIALNGGTRITLDRKDPRHATLERGEALFDVVHDDDAPFKVLVGDTTLVDVGTSFNVVRDGRVTAVQVSEGAVVYDPDGAAVRLDAGRRLRAEDGDPHIELAAVAPDAVAAWREGRLIYDGQTMADVAADLTRWSGETVRADPRVAAQRFRGVLSLGKDDDVAGLASLLDVDVRRSGREWILSPRNP